MSRVLIFAVFVVVIVGCTYAAPAEEETKEVPKDVAKVSTPAQDKATTLTETHGWDTYLSGNHAWTIITGSIATLFIIGGLGLGFYYFYWLSYNGNTYSGNVGGADSQVPYGNPQYNPNSGYFSGYSGPQAYNYQAAARALRSTSNLSWTRVLDLLSMAQETYEKFDFQSLDCQKKALCELQQKQADFGDTGRKISSSFSFMDALDGLPMPTIIQTYLKEYKEAILQGKNSTKDCSTVYPKCNFSIKEVFVKYSKKSHKL